MILRKQQKKFKLRFRAFKRKPFLFLRHFLLIIIFRFFGVIICLFFTVLPLPLSNFIQHLMNLNLSLNSLKDILSSVKQLATNFYTIIPSTNDIMRFIKSFLLNFSPSNFYNILRSLPHDLRQFFLQAFDYLRQRLKDIRLFIKSLFPLRQALSRLRIFIITHTNLVKRLFRNLLMVFFNVLLIKILFLIIIPLLGISTIYFIGVDISLIIIATLSLLTSQLGSLIGRLVTNTLIHLYDIIQRRTSKMNIFLFLIALLYNKISLFIKKIRLRLIFLFSCLLQKICLYFIALYLYYKIQRQKF
ncbi:hypothetical protein MU1CBH_07470 [Megamonas funiformis]|uniref:hypothetical protein n=1 Tax=Megamonas funiformis TaxID=437897 RepID=UPI001CC753FA|nr:hypothetical protein [Megamonas funiformis]BDA09719.1 hypothetical protein MU1CBH_07470 [Megamonas funiformis]